MKDSTLQDKVLKLSTLVGNTPIRKLWLTPQRFIYMKEEGKNPAGSIKDRPALNMLLHAILNGEVTQDTIVAESTSGNTGIGLAWVSHELGLEYHNYSPNSLSERKRAILGDFGAKLYFSAGGTDDATKMLQTKIEADPAMYYWASQFTNPNNWRAHLENTAPELLRQVPHVQEVWVAFGSGGTSTGFAHALNGTGVALRVVQNTLDRAQRVEGMRNLAWISKPPIADLDAIGRNNLSSADPNGLLDLARRIYQYNDGFIVGPTTAAIMTQAQWSEARVVVVVSADNGDRYPQWIEQVTNSASNWRHAVELSRTPVQIFPPKRNPSHWGKIQPRQLGVVSLGGQRVALDGVNPVNVPDQPHGCLRVNGQTSLLALDRGRGKFGRWGDNRPNFPQPLPTP
jgi:cysteine synthase